jgi:hypothetical protein
MKSRRIYFLIFILFIASFSFSQNENQMTPEQQKKMDAYIRMGTINENHEFLKQFVGEWNVTSRGWMMPGQDPIVTECKAKAELIMDGRFLVWRIQGNMFGQLFESLQIVGYDNLQKKYITFWIDSTSTAFYMMDGARQGNVIRNIGLWPDPVTGGQEKARDVLTVVGPDEFTYELFMVGADGKEFKSVENRCTRNK